MKLTLDGLANVATAVMALAIALAAGTVAWATYTSAEPPPTVQPYTVGDPISLPVTVDFTASPRTVILFVQSRCRFCTESMSFYKDILDKRAHLAPQLRIVALTPEEPQVTHNYLESHGVSVDEVIQTEITGTRFLGTPTVLSIDHSGMIEGVWLGRLTAEQEQSVRKAIFNS